VQDKRGISMIMLAGRLPGPVVPVNPMGQRTSRAGWSGIGWLLAAVFTLPRWCGGRVGTDRRARLQTAAWPNSHFAGTNRSLLEVPQFPDRRA